MIKNMNCILKIQNNLVSPKNIGRLSNKNKMMTTGFNFIMNKESSKIKRSQKQ